MYEFQINGLDIQASFSEETIARICLPLLAKLTAVYRVKGRRIIAFLAGPPGSGKSTLAAFLERLSRGNPDLEPIQSVGIDGFHYPADYILTHTVERCGRAVPMRDVKGCPESYDTAKLYEALQALNTRNVRWPGYDRRTHDIAEGTLTITGNIAFVEGNWLLFKEGQWAGLRSLCDYSVMLRAGEDLLRSRLIGRKIRGGMAPREAEEFYAASDGPNVSRCMSGSSEADLDLCLDPAGALRIAPERAAI